MRGRKPKTAAQAARDGDTRKIGRRKLAARVRAEAAGATGLPECPVVLRGRGRWLWEYLVKDLEHEDCMRRLDVPMLIGVCKLFQAACQKNTSKFWTAFKALATEFPLSPVARTRLLGGKAVDAGEQDLAKLLAKPRPARPVTIQ